MSGLLSFGYWFSVFPPVLVLTAQIVFAAIFVALLAAGLLIYFVFRRGMASKLRKQAWGTIGQVLLWAGICGLVWLLMTVLGVPALGMRFWLLVGFLFFAGLLYAPLKSLRLTIPRQEELALNKASYEKWLPKPKK